MHRRACSAWLKHRAGESNATSDDTLGETSVQDLALDLAKNVGYMHVVKTLELFDSDGRASVRSFEKAMAVTRLLGITSAPGNNSSKIASHLVSVCGGWERFVNRQLATHASVLGLGQDGKDRRLLVAFRAVLWKLPKALHHMPVDGLRQVIPGPSGLSGPWVADRTLGVATLKADRTAHALAGETLHVLQATMWNEEGMAAWKEKALYWTADNASNETHAHALLHEELPRLDFDMADDTHSLMLAIKNGCKGEPEVEIVQGIFVTNKKPYPSIGNMLAYSSRFRSIYTEEQQGGIHEVCTHLGWSPARHASRSRTYSRATRGIRDLLGALAREASGKSSKREAAKHNIKAISGYCRLMIAGMMADLTVEHQMAVLCTDKGDPDVTQVLATELRFENVVKVLFFEGQIMITQNTYTAQILKFFKKPSVVFAAEEALLFAMPTDAADVYEPLQRMRVIAENVLRCKRAAMPAASWQHAFAAYTLPNPLAPDSSKPASVKKFCRDKFLRIFTRAKAKEPQEILDETIALIPAAEKFARNGAGIKEAWAHASLETPNLLGGRFSVDLLLGAFHSTSNIERALKIIGSRDNTGPWGDMSDIALCDLHAPAPGQVSVCEGASVAPKTLYLHKILSTYRQVFGGRAWAKAPKKRRDQGLHKDKGRRDKRRAARGAPLEEAAFKRKRQAEISELLGQSAVEREAKRQRGFRGLPVPADTGEKVTEAVLRLRQRATEREERKSKRFAEDVSSREVPRPQTSCGPVWVGQACAVDGQTSAVDGQTSAGAQAMRKGVCAIFLRQAPADLEDVLLRRKHQLKENWPQYAQEALQSGSERLPGMVLVPSLQPGTLTDSPLAVACRLFGGFLSSTAWVQDSIRRDKVPLGMGFPGCMSLQMILHLSPNFARRFESFADMLEVLGAAATCKITVARPSAGEPPRKAADKIANALKHACQHYRTQHGARSRPWSRIRLICTDDADVAQMIEQCDLKEVPRIASSWKDFLERHARVDHAKTCPGHWHFPV